MSPSSTPVTPLGVRDGDPAALAGLAERRSGSVVDYMRLACGSDAVVMDATAEAFARFRGAVVAAEDPYALAPDPLLLSCTRHSAAAMTRVDARTADCHATPFLLVGEYEGVNAPTDRARLTRHLATCDACARIATGYADAENAFRAPHVPEADTAIVARIIAALQAAGPAPDAVQETTPEPVLPALEVGEPEPDDDPFDDDDPFEDLDADPEDSLLVAAPAEGAHADGPGRPVDGSENIARRLVLPAAIVTIGVLSAMTIAGVFGGTSPAPARGTSDLPGPVPPKRPPPADPELQSKAAAAARAALRRIDARERATTVAAARERARETEREAEAAKDDPETPETPAPRSEDPPDATPRPDPTPRPTPPREDGDTEVTAPETGSEGSDGAGGPSVFEPQATPTP